MEIFKSSSLQINFLRKRIFDRKVSALLNKMNCKGSFLSDSSSKYIQPYTFFYKNKLYQSNEADIGKKNKNNLRTFWGWKVENKIKIIIYMYFQNLLTKK